MISEQVNGEVVALDGCINLIRAEETPFSKKFFIEAVCELIKLHGEYARKLGITDKIVDEYTEESAAKHFDEEGYYNFIILKAKIYVGILQIKVKKSEFNSLPAIKICKAYIHEIARNTGVFAEAIELVLKCFPEVKSLELDCWYGLPANEVYQHMGFKEAMRLYVKEV